MFDLLFCFISLFVAVWILKLLSRNCWFLGLQFQLWILLDFNQAPFFVISTCLHRQLESLHSSVCWGLLIELLKRFFGFVLHMMIMFSLQHCWSESCFGGGCCLFSFFFLQVWTWSSQVLGPVLWRYPFILDWRVRRWLRLGHRRIVGGPRDFRQEQGAGGDSLTLGHARSFGLRYTRASGQERRPIRRVSMVQGWFSDLRGRRPWLLGQPVLGPCSEHSCHLGLSGGAHGRGRGLSRCWRTIGWSYWSNLPRRLLRSLGLGWRPRHFRWAEGERVEEWKTGHVLHVWILRAGHRHWQGPIGQFERSFGRPSCQQCLGLCHQLHPRILD